LNRDEEEEEEDK